MRKAIISLIVFCAVALSASMIPASMVPPSDPAITITIPIIIEEPAAPAVTEPAPAPQKAPMAAPVPFDIYTCRMEDYLSSRDFAHCQDFRYPA